MLSTANRFDPVQPLDRCIIGAGGLLPSLVRLGAETDQNYMNKRLPQAPELKALLAQLQAPMSPKQRLRMQAAVVTAEVIARIQGRSRLK